MRINKYMKKPKELKSWHSCYQCGVKMFGEPSEEDMRCITVMSGECPYCEKKDVTLIPHDDFIGIGD